MLLFESFVTVVALVLTGAGDEGSAAPSTPIKDSNETSTSGALSSHSSGLDKAIDAAKQDDEEEDPDVRWVCPLAWCLKDAEGGLCTAVSLAGFQTQGE